MTYYEVSHATRKHGAIGEFGSTSQIIAAETADAARDIAFNNLHKPPYEWETAGCHVRELTAAEQMAMFDQQAINEEYRA